MAVQRLYGCQAWHSLYEVSSFCSQSKIMGWILTELKNICKDVIIIYMRYQHAVSSFHMSDKLAVISVQDCVCYTCCSISVEDLLERQRTLSFPLYFVREEPLLCVDESLCLCLSAASKSHKGKLFSVSLKGTIVAQTEWQRKWAVACSQVTVLWSCVFLCGGPLC